MKKVVSFIPVCLMMVLFASMTVMAAGTSGAAQGNSIMAFFNQHKDTIFAIVLVSFSFLAGAFLSRRNRSKMPEVSSVKEDAAKEKRYRRKRNKANRMRYKYK